MARLKTNTVKKERPADSTGNRLRNERESKNISIEEAHKATKIHPSVLEALEQDRLGETLGATYVKAFLRSYAGYLGLDAKGILSGYSQATASGIREEAVLEPKPFLLTKDKRLGHQVVVTTLIVIAWLLILSFAATKLMGSYRYFVNQRKIKSAAALKEKPAVKEIPQKSAKKLIPIPQGRTISLTVTTDREVWLKVTQDGKVAFHRTLSKNSRETWRADKEIILAEIGKPEALKLNVNGKDIDLTGVHLGRNVHITHEGIDIEAR